MALLRFFLFLERVSKGTPLAGPVDLKNKAVTTRPRTKEA
jgi:hypothetical protein